MIDGCQFCTTAVLGQDRWAGQMGQMGQTGLSNIQMSFERRATCEQLTENLQPALLHVYRVYVICMNGYVMLDNDPWS